ncbi:TAXI family TRAP transporter solute-binding subunit [Sphaerisporangium perillae]|uniref:TAXI family TRAP transporter solute-binding subunit n=1 Tax=Sphaerisporangium perillae TaxID=2935860 RepID=UPI00200D0A14|nr:TAXI family TRAP transporter solute-binding subunit [Sphaerisporangium perillae]
MRLTPPLTRRAALALPLAMALNACSAGRPPLRRLVIATGGKGGVYYELGRALAGHLHRQWGSDTEVRATAASVENLKLVADGMADVAFASLDSVALAVAGLPPFTRPLPLSALAQIYDDYVQIVSLRGTSVDHLDDLSGHHVGVGAPGSGTELVANRVLGMARFSGLQRLHLSVADSVQALVSGRIQAFFFSGGLPTPAIAGLSAAKPIHVIPLGEYVEILQRRYQDVYVRKTIPAMTYNLSQGSVPTVGIHNLLVVNDRMDPGEAYWLTRVLFEARGEFAAAHAEAQHLHERTAIFTAPAPLHPGAIRYYREVKSVSSTTL